MGGVHYPRSINYLGQLGSKLRDLRGFSTLAHELIQNADDADGATSMAFDFQADSLVVDNDGAFTDCGDLHSEPDACPRKQISGAMCDFHRFRNVAAGDKRNEEKLTAGAFGIGFTAVYQITDRPELISAGRHWLIDETQPEDRRITECSGCSKCDRDDLPGTRFILPWARDPDSDMRRGLSAEPVGPEPELTLSAELKTALSTAMLFLEKLACITVTVLKEAPIAYERVIEGDRLRISHGHEVSEWVVLRSDFAAAAEKLRSEHKQVIEGKRRSVVSLAVSLNGPVQGVFCAFLPTQERLGLPFHVNADFFPSSDRKRVLLDDDVRSDWNRAAITEAAAILATSIPVLTKMLGIKVWQVFEALKKLHTDATNGSVHSALGAFWVWAKPAIAAVDTILTSEGTWCSPLSVRNLQDRDEERFIDLLSNLGIAVVSPDLRPVFGLLQEVGVRPLDAVRVVEAMRRIGLEERKELADLPAFLDLDALARLRNHFSMLLTREPSGRRADAIAAVASCTLVPGSDGAIWPAARLYAAESNTRKLFAPLGVPGLDFAEIGPEEAELTDQLCSKFGVEEAISALSGTDVTEALGASDEMLRRMLSWFERNLEGPPYAEDIRAEVAALPIFPSSTGLRSLDGLSLPGGFTDPLGLSDVVDVVRLHGRTEFLVDLGATPLTFERYARQYLADAFNDPALPETKRSAALDVLAQRYHEVDRSTRQVLSRAPYIPCSDGLFRAPEAVHIDSEANRRLLGAIGRFAALPPGVGDDEFLLWAGVHLHPSPESVGELVESLTRDRPAGEAVERIEALLAHLSGRLTREPELAGYEFLRTLAWLPAKGDSTDWHLPADVYANYSEHLFASQARFLAVRNQTSIATVLEFLGVPNNPTVVQVVKHLLKCAETGERVNSAVYRRLNENATDRSITLLLGKKCILADSEYVSPRMVFWGGHQFGRFRYQLSPDLRAYSALLDALGVREAPEVEDAAEVLEDIARSPAASSPLDDEDLGVIIQCWRMLSDALDEDGGLDLTRLRGRRVIPDQRRVLNPPERMLFDDRVGLASKFGTFLENNILPRPHLGWRAMEAAGVSTLSSQVITEVVERTDPRHCADVRNRVLSRVELIRRVLGPDVQHESPSLGLDSLDFTEVSSLQVVYRLRIFGGRSSDPEQVDAHFDAPVNEVYIRRDGHKIPWGQLARELARLLDPDSAVATLASGIKEALAPDDFREAERALDDLGFARATSTELMHSTAHARELSALGVENEPDDHADAEPQANHQEREPAPRAPDSTEDNGAGGGTGDDQGADSSERKQPTRRKKGRLRSYVVRGEERSAGERAGTEAKRDFVDQCGVDRVIALERRSHREPEVMALNHPGFDIISRGEHETRYIEVKSLSERWADDGVGLSATQFAEARELGEEYWLYVVEFATSEHYVVHKICDPATNVDQFFFDAGWSALDDE